MAIWEVLQLPRDLNLILTPLTFSCIKYHADGLQIIFTNKMSDRKKFHESYKWGVMAYEKTNIIVKGYILETNEPLDIYVTIYYHCKLLPII